MPIAASAQKGNEEETDGCVMTTLSKQYDLELVIKERDDEDGNALLQGIVVYMLAKGQEARKQKLETTINDASLRDISCASYSWSTGHREGNAADIEALIVGDFNFDERHDIALLTGRNASGLLYSYYIQEPGGRFVQDEFLSGHVALAPASLDTSRRQLTIQRPHNALLVLESLFIYDTAMHTYNPYGSRFITAIGAVALTGSGFDYASLGSPLSVITTVYPQQRMFKQRTEAGLTTMIGDISFYGTVYDLQLWINDSTSSVQGMEVRDARISTATGAHAGMAARELLTDHGLKAAFYELSDTSEQLWVCLAEEENMRFNFFIDDGVRRALRGKENSTLTAEEIPENAIVERITIVENVCR